jgi:hypothetical protein
MDKRIAALEDKLTDRLVEVLVKARFDEETAQMLRVLDGNVPESTLRQVAAIIEGYTQERFHGA